jgi:RNA polymerase sigma factor (sigma-70 family)
VKTHPLQRLVHRLRQVAGSSVAPTDGHLLERWVSQRDETAFELLLRRHGPMALAVCRRLLRDGGAAEDAFQAAWLVFLRKAGSLRRRESVAAWLHRVACRVALRMRTTTARRTSREVPAVDLPAPATGDEVSERDLRAAVDQEIDRLPEGQRRAFVLCCLEGKTHAEAARELGCPQGTASAWVARARQRLRSRLTRRGVTLGATALGAELAEGAAAVPAVLVRGVLGAATVAEGMVSANVAVLVEGTVRAMLITKLQTAAALLVAVSLVLAGGGLWTYRTLADSPQASAGSAGSSPAAADTSKKPERTKTVQDDRARIQGTWKVVDAQFAGTTKLDIAYGRLVFMGDKVSFEGLRVFQGPYRLDPSKSPKEIDLGPFGGLAGGKIWRGVYALEGDRLTLCYDNSGGPRSASLKSKPGTNQWRIVLRRERAARGDGGGEVRVQWLDEPKGIKRSRLKVELDPAATVQRTKGGLLLSARLRNLSGQQIKARLTHEWHGGEWPPTDLYASVTPEQAAKPEPFRPVYQMGERQSAPKRVTIAAGKSVDVGLRLDWPGTGSLIAVPLVENSAHGRFRVRLLLAFEANGVRQFVVGAEKVVEVPAKPEPGKANSLPQGASARPASYIQLEVKGKLVCRRRKYYVVARDTAFPDIEVLVALSRSEDKDRALDAHLKALEGKVVIVSGFLDCRRIGERGASQLQPAALVLHLSQASQVRPAEGK